MDNLEDMKKRSWVNLAHSINLKLKRKLENLFEGMKGVKGLSVFVAVL